MKELPYTKAQLKVWKKQVVEHWEENIAGAREGQWGEIDIGGDSCSYCDEFIKLIGIRKRCRICPLPQCHGSVWRKMQKVMLLGIIDGGLFIKYAEQMLRLIRKRGYNDARRNYEGES